MASAKGVVMVGLVKRILDNPEQARPLLPPKLHHYFETRIVQAAWYPIEDYIALLRVAPKLEKNPPKDFYEQMGRASAREQMSGIYSRLKDNLNRKASATLLASMYDSGTWNVVERSPGHAVVEWVGFASPAREICGTFTGYQAERMALQGIEEVRAKHTVCRAEGGATCRWELDWKSRRGDAD
jgi:hypothetical protein